VVFFMATIALAAKPAGIQYISPVNNSTLNSRTSGIIIRPGAMLDKASIDFSQQIVVTDAANNRYSGNIVLSSDGKTLIFKPHGQFNAGEVVEVSFLSGVKDQSGSSIPSFTFQFTVTPLKTMLDPKDYVPETGSDIYSLEDSNAESLPKTATDNTSSDWPSGVPKITLTPGTGTPAAGYFFLSPSHFDGIEGYNLILDNSGNLVYWKKITDGTPVCFSVLPNGNLGYGSMYEFSKVTGGGPTKFWMMDSSYTIVDSFAMGNGYIAESHEFQLLPNGHALLLSYDLQPVDMSKIVEGGHPGATVMGSIIQELDGDKNVVFQWRSWDYLDLKDSYNDLTLKVFDAIHINSIDMDPDNNLLVSIMAFGEIVKINRQTGEIIWIMGGRNNQFTFINDDEGSAFAPQYFMYQHEVRRIDNGNILMIDDGQGKVRQWTRAVEYKIDETAKTATKVWQYRHNPDLYAPSMGTAQRLPNGNTLIGWGQASASSKTAVTEVDPSGNVVLELAFTGSLWASYRACKFDWHGGTFAAKVLRWELAADNSYTWNDEDGDTDTGTTGITMDIKSHNGFGYNEIWAFRYNYAPLKLEFSGKTPVVLPHRIVLRPFNLPGLVATFKFDAEFYKLPNPDSIVVYYRRGVGVDSAGAEFIVWHDEFIALPTKYNQVTKQVYADFTDPGADTTANVACYYEIIFAYSDYAHQTFPPLLVSPSNNADVNISNAVLEWSPVGFAKSYSLQVATDAGFSNLVVDKNGLTQAVYTFDASGKDTSTYYWRAKTANDAGESEWASAKLFHTRKPYIKVTSPNGGEKLKWGRENFITWTSITKGDVVIELHKGDGTFLEVIDTATNSGGYTWDVPTDLDTTKSYKIVIKDVADESISDISDASFKLEYVGIISMKRGSGAIKTDFQLVQSRPFNPITKIRYQLAAFTNVELSIYSIHGKKVVTLVNKNQLAGTYEITFDASELASTVYFVKFRAGKNYIQTRKLALMK
jgi:hypothetical protein